MPAYILETGRSFPNPVDGEDYERPMIDYDGSSYTLSFLDEGPGSMPLGRDNVHYIGDEEPTCVSDGGDCNKYNRQPIYRWYRGSKYDHKYTKREQLREEDAVGDNEEWQKVLRGYNPEPRSGDIPAFFIMRDQVVGSVPIYSHYRGRSNDDSILTLSATPPASDNSAPYRLVGKLGYVFPTAAAAQAGAAAGETAVPLYHYFKDNVIHNGSAESDNFYTINPAAEINLSGGPIPPKRAAQEEYDYQGILCYVFAQDSPDATKKQVIDIGQIGPTGQCIDKSGWYAWNTTYSYSRYRTNIGVGTPATDGYGWPVGEVHGGGSGVSIQDSDANFEWLYGLNGAIKGAVPRFLGFQYGYDSQFMYYLYDTSYPWNGPIFGIQYQLSDRACCPNSTCTAGSTGQERPYPCCIPNSEFYSHFYEIRQDSWKTTKSSITLEGGKGSGVEESFMTAGTDDLVVFFRYTSSSGSFRKGELFQGWVIGRVFYFGDKMKCGYMELTQYNDTDGNKFTYNQTITAEDGATAVVLAGYGIKDKVAFWGVYEFEKNIQYYKVKIDPQALIPTRTLDLAEAEAVVNTEGEVTSIRIINGGVGYINPVIVISDPQQLEEFSAEDTAAEVRSNFKSNYKEGVNQFPEPETAGETKHAQRRILRKASRKYGKTDREFDTVLQYEAAEAKITDISESGIIRFVTVTKRGRGYDPQNPPTVYIAEQGLQVQVESKLDSPEIQAAPTQVEGVLSSDTLGTDMSDYQNIIKQSFGAISEGSTTNVPITYMELAEVDPDGKFALCQTLPADCIDIKMGLPLTDAFPPGSMFDVLAQSDGFNEYQSKHHSAISSELQGIQGTTEGLDGLYGAFNGNRCIYVEQPIIYNIKKWFQMPCAYMAADEDEESRTYGKTVAFGYLPYKYCASKEEEAQFQVHMNIEGTTTGSQGQAFMEWLNSMPKPRMTERRKVGGGKKTWNCSRGTVQGRCYRDPNNSSDLVFVPVGLDENTFDYNRSDFTELEQFELWLGDNVSGYTPNYTWGSWVTQIYDPTNPAADAEGFVQGSGSESFTAIEVNGFNCPTDPLGIPEDCWDRYVRKGSNTDGPLDVYCGYDADGNGIAGETYYEISHPTSSTSYSLYFTGQSSTGTGLCHSCNALESVADVSIAIDPSRITQGKYRMKMGPYSGTFKVLNYLTGGTTALSRTIRNLGNPYFDECQDEYPYTDGRVFEGVT